MSRRDTSHCGQPDAVALDAAPVGQHRHAMGDRRVRCRLPNRRLAMQAGRSSPIGQSPGFFHTMGAANKAGKAALKRRTNARRCHEKDRHNHRCFDDDGSGHFRPACRGRSAQGRHERQARAGCPTAVVSSRPRRLRGIVAGRRLIPEVAYSCASNKPL
jgi:hypothetical protein